MNRVRSQQRLIFLFLCFLVILDGLYLLHDITHVSRMHLMVLLKEVSPILELSLNSDSADSKLYHLQWK